VRGLEFILQLDVTCDTRLLASFPLFYSLPDFIFSLSFFHIFLAEVSIVFHVYACPVAQMCSTFIPVHVEPLQPKVAESCLARLAM
jgi:hypothetical protein